MIRTASISLARRASGIVESGIRHIFYRVAVTERIAYGEYQIHKNAVLQNSIAYGEYALTIVVKYEFSGASPVTTT